MPASCEFLPARIKGAITLCLAGAALAGCSLADANPAAHFAALLAAPPPEVSLFVASTRPQGRGSEPVLPARHSLVRVSIPAGHKAGVIELPRYGAARRGRHFMVAGERPMNQSEFSAEIASHLSGRVGSDRDVLVFVHGFNTSLEEAHFRLAQIVADGRFGGVAVLFTWPSANKILAYESDKQAATISRDALTQLLRELGHAPGAGRIHLLAHSMGAWLTMESLRELAIGGEQRLNGRTGEVMLAAPDIDMGVFRQQMSRLGRGVRVSVFASRGDRALHLSARIAGARPRLGAIDASRAADRQQLSQLGVRVYDISAFSSGFVGHDNYANAPAVVRTIGAELTRARPEDRNTTAIIDGGVARPSEAPFVPAPVESAPLPDLPGAAAQVVQ
ncbi:MAG: alpha/beta fold hydrolase [Alphaproteobacteria bacterium]|nr:alpha/beta fold hydrolase [Alphaproteobacteria bacterium]